MIDPTQRFSSRVQNYIKYRPHYPPAVLEALTINCHLTPQSVLADIGSGTGLLAELFLRNGNRVYGVEPNREMREAGERLLSNQHQFRSVAGRAEATTLPDQSVDFITAGQAFHWFDPEPAHAEFVRILKPDGWMVIVWNERETSRTAFLQAYEGLLQRFGTDYQQVDHSRIDDSDLRAFFGANGFAFASFPNQQEFDRESLRGRLLSSSYTPEPKHPDYEPMLAELNRIFDNHQKQDRVLFEYTTKMYYGHLQ